MEIAETEEMEIEEQTPTPSRSNFKRFGLKNAIQTNFGEDYVFEIVAKDDWTSIAVSLSTNAVKLYSPQTGQYLGECKGHSSTINQISFAGPSSPHVLYSCSSDSTIRAWDSRSFQQVACINSGPSEEVFSFSFGGADGSLIAAGCKAQIPFWDWRTMKQTACLEESHMEDVTQVHFVPGHQNKLVSASVDGLMCLFDTSGEINDDDHLVSVFNVGTSIGKVGFCGEASNKLWCLTHIETLSVWDWNESRTEATFDDARALASKSWTLDHVDYFVDCHYSPEEDRLWAIGGTNAGTFGYFPVNFGSTKTIGSAEAVFQGGHTGIVRTVLPMSSIPGKSTSRGIFGWTGGEDGRLCCWLSDESTETNCSWIWATVSGIDEKKAPGVDYQSNLSYHGSAVNTLRFSPSGEQLASGADGGELLLWKLHVTDAGEVWKVHKSLVFHRKDVLDLQWSADGAYLISGSVDNSCIIWDAIKGSVHQILDAHFHYVQGVAWDPLGKYAASFSSDRTCRIYINTPSKAKSVERSNHVCQHVISKAELAVGDESKSARSHLFLDETLPSFFRRLAWSPDGSFLVVPAGFHKITPTSEPVNTAYVFSRKDISRPALMLPGATKPVVAVRFCPMKFELLGTNTSSLFKLPYRLIFAVATLNSLYVYDTESIQPIVIVAGVHYAAITDIAWSPSGNYLVLSSQDGYCTLLEFENQELGSPLSISEKKQVPGDENKSPVVEALVEDSRSACVDSNKEKEENYLKEKDDGKQASPSTAAPQTKAAKRRITPMAID